MTPLVARRRQVFMFGIVEVRASRRFAPILLEAGIGDLLQPDARSVESYDGVLSDEIEEITTVLLSRAMTILVGQMSEHLGLLFGRNFEKPASEQVAGMRVNPPDPIP